MEKDQKILITIISIILVIAIGVCIYLFINRDSVKLNDGEKFEKEYEALNNKKFLGEDNKYYNYINVNLSKNNIYVYKTEEEIIDLLKKGTGLIYLGFSSCPRCRNIVNPLMEVAKKNDINQIYYLDIEDIRDTYEIVNEEAVQSVKGTESYYKMVNILDKYLDFYTLTDENNKEYNTGVKRIYASTVLAVKNGKVVGFHNSTIEGQNILEPLKKEETKKLKNIYQEMMQEMQKEIVCTDKGC